MVVVPRLFEVLRTRDHQGDREAGQAFPISCSTAPCAIGAQARGRRRADPRPADEPDPQGHIAAQDLKRFGGRMKAMVSGGAPLNPEVGIFFQSLGLTFLQGYGQTEAGAGDLVQPAQRRPKAMDTVGPPLKGVEVKIAEDGEILVRGELVMHGYWRNEEEQARPQGWLAAHRRHRR
jgi:long-chain acyl-CoA synthetase